MKRLNPVGSLIGLALTILLFVGLVISLWFNQGLAFSPGLITAKSLVGVAINGFVSHADFEKQCGKCHEPLHSDLATKCLQCHSEVKAELQSGQGAHSQGIEINQCASCHPDHRGRNFDPTLASFQKFDHSTTAFSLIWHQENYDATPMQCSECHEGVDFSQASDQTCLDCHANHDPTFGDTHVANFGSKCQACHDGADQMQNFDHNQAGFPLEGRHAEINCTACHSTGNVKDTPQDCASCHEEPGMHKGLFQQSCEACHNPQSWSPALVDGKPFGHLQDAGFSLQLHQLDYSSHSITCTTCHPTSLQAFDRQTCIDCHSRQDSAFISDHDQQYGSECLTCHDGVDRLSNFQHANFFPLDGKHATLQCADCHANKTFRGTPSECTDCHTEPEIHAGIFGLKCNYCHTDSAWSPASLQQHVFPLNHGLEDANLQSTCSTCHGANYIDYTCYNCHDHQQDEISQSHLDAGVTQQELPRCAECHPSGILTSDQKKP